jgi:predicted transcriptional regulator
LKTLREMVVALNEGGFTQDRIAKEVGVTQPTICRIQRGESIGQYDMGKRIELMYVKHQRRLSRKKSTAAADANYACN